LRKENDRDEEKHENEKQSRKTWIEQVR